MSRYLKIYDSIANIFYFNFISRNQKQYRKCSSCVSCSTRGKRNAVDENFQENCVTFHSGSLDWTHNNKPRELFDCNIHNYVTIFHNEITTSNIDVIRLLILACKLSLINKIFFRNALYVSQCPRKCNCKEFEVEFLWTSFKFCGIPQNNWNFL